MLSVMRTLMALTLSALIGAGTACVIHSHPTSEPPPPRYTYVDYRPGYVWIDGHWAWHGRWVWSEGYWVPERRGHYYVQGHWARRGGRHVWVDGSWRRGKAPAGVRSRDHRRPPAKPHRSRGNTVVPSRRGKGATTPSRTRSRPKNTTVPSRRGRSND